jgi:hypothetical protein
MDFFDLKKHELGVRGNFYLTKLCCMFSAYVMYISLMMARKNCVKFFFFFGGGEDCTNIFS